jgi:hypothetical protein
MTTPTEAVARLLAKDARFYDAWQDLNDGERERYMRRAASLLRAADAARWRAPTEADWRSHDEINFVFMTKDMTEWSCLYFGSIRLNLMRSEPGLRVMIADPLALPEIEP